MNRQISILFLVPSDDIHLGDQRCVVLEFAFHNKLFVKRRLERKRLQKTDDAHIHRVMHCPTNAHMSQTFDTLQKTTSVQFMK